MDQTSAATAMVGVNYPLLLPEGLKETWGNNVLEGL